MSASKRVRGGSVAIDTVPLPEKTIKMTTKKGKVLRIRGKYFLVVGRRKTEIPVGPIVSKKEIGQLVGKEVYAAFSKRRKSEIVAIGTWPTPERPKVPVPCYWIICYLVGPDMMRRVGPAVRETLIRKLVSEEVISPRLAREVRVGIKQRM